MAITYTLGANPIWDLINTFGELAGGAQLFAYSSLNPTLFKSVFQDAGGILEWPQPITFNLNGTQGPFYFEFDPANPQDLYYLVALDSDGNLLWSINNYNPSSGSGGGGGNITNYVSFTNLVGNNIFLNNIGNLTSVPSTQTVLAPSNHQGMVYIPSATDGAVGPDLMFVKNNTAASDSISFVNFIPGTILGNDVTPPQYLQYQSTSALGETYKYFQFPICSRVSNLAGQQMTFTCWAQAPGGSATFNASFRQYFGAGGAPSSDVNHDITGNISVGSTWQLITATFTVPAVTGKTIGTCGDDASYLQINVSLGVTVNLAFTKPSLYVGIAAPTSSFVTYDQVDSQVQTYRTADVRITNNFFGSTNSNLSVGNYGWVPANNGTIGSASSNATNRANVDTFPLFDALWQNFQSVQNLAPMYTSAGAATAYGPNSVSDFSANNQISLTRFVGNALAGKSEVPAAQTFTANFSTGILTIANSLLLGNASPVMVSNSGGSLPSGLSATTIYYAVYQSSTTIKLASTIANALAGTGDITFTTNGTGTNSIQIYNPNNGFIDGNTTHTLIRSELPDPITVTAPAFGYQTLAAGPVVLLQQSSAFNASIPNTGGNQPHSIMQPTVFTNVYLKL